jgi:hypothetical protein
MQQKSHQPELCTIPQPRKHGSGFLDWKVSLVQLIKGQGQDLVQIKGSGRLGQGKVKVRDHCKNKFRHR